jgi:hypothetical protein
MIMIIILIESITEKLKIVNNLPLPLYFSRIRVLSGCQVKIPFTPDGYPVVQTPCHPTMMLVIPIPPLPGKLST